MAAPAEKPQGRKGKWRFRLGGIVSLRFERGLPRLVIIDRFERPVKYTIWLLTVLAIVSSVFIFPAWYDALGFSIGVFCLQYVLQRTVFQYVSMYIQPIPDFEFNVQDWTAMAYGFPERRGAVPDIVTPAFRTKALARNFMRLLRDWNNEENEDRENNICFSIILESDMQYRCFIYPNPARAKVKNFNEAVSRDGATRYPGKEHLQLVFQVMFMRTFPYDSNSNLATFIRLHKAHEPFDIRPAVWSPEGGLRMLDDIAPITKWHLKIAERAQLKVSDLEHTYPL